MKKVVLNGISFGVLTRVEVKKIASSNIYALNSVPELYLYPAPTVQEMVVMAGFNLTKIDTAIPQAWVDQHPKLSPQAYVWFYGPTSGLFGEPLSLLECRHLVRNQIISLLVETWLEHEEVLHAV